MPMPPAFETAATSFGRLMKAIPASMMGCLIPKSSVILVFIVFSPFGTDIKKWSISSWDYLRFEMFLQFLT
jgi:hypothetical protein